LVGESVRDSALPWDTVSTTRFSKGEPLDTTIQSLTASHDKRSSQDPNFLWLKEGIREVEEARARDAVSLNIDTRRGEREDQLAGRLNRENERRKALHLEPLESLDDIDRDDLPDVLLEQAAGIVTDLAELREMPVSPAQTAQIRP
jgi:carboxyl-terminal processing protease